MTVLSADQLVEKGKWLREHGNLVVFLYPSQEWMAVETQTPFLRYEPIPTIAHGECAPDRKE